MRGSTAYVLRANPRRRAPAQMHGVAHQHSQSAPAHTCTIGWCSRWALVCPQQTATPARSEISVHTGRQAATCAADVLHSCLPTPSGGRLSTPKALSLPLRASVCPLPRAHLASVPAVRWWCLQSPSACSPCAGHPWAWQGRGSPGRHCTTAWHSTAQHASAQHASAQGTRTGDVPKTSQCLTHPLTHTTYARSHTSEPETPPSQEGI